MSFSSVFHSPLVATVELPTEAEFKAKLEDGFGQASNYFVVVFAVCALIFAVRGLVS